ncbi:MAG: SCP2 sterol-binding domain-containing protein [Anaerolineae bacterium]|nr:SCP2 sterol-binding domain-containing protein [Anaerolineae bacterium]MCO5190332.1 SCP2 sterol-binding domain-containing protein [Anaerolineae bacterium]MCO5192377.1 SCP2 sterol-binding domain-containing protein [Anaerolineae bacterium]MCO5198491.1 SCP2 sterol-binding domain-containing protein [Anaerolineae bacterium]MCO5203857.1 SCP2 sterol-binding domain-containing protein [Anaerolineae bacterium]
MTVFQNSDDFYDCLQETFTRVTAKNPASFHTLEKMKLTVLIATTDPDAYIYVDGKQTPAKITLGKTSNSAELHITGTTDALHLVLLGTLGIVDSMKSKQLVVQGSIFKAVSLADFFHAGQDTYPDVLREKGYL